MHGTFYSYGVCDGCSLGPRGLQDDVIEGTHLCMSRQKLLRNNTVEVFFGSGCGRYQSPANAKQPTTS